MKLKSGLLSLYKFAQLELGKKPVHFIHIGKTGGTAIKAAFERKGKVSGNLIPQGKFLYIMHGHDFRLDMLNDDEECFFVVRDPLQRFVSGFNSRLRMGRPRNYNPWSNEEKEAFAVFKTPDQLGRAISSHENTMRLKAHTAMKGIGHVRSSYWDWFTNESLVKSMAHQIQAVFRLEHLDEDFRKFRSDHSLTIGDLSSNETVSHRSPDYFDKLLSEDAMRNLKEWYQDDYRFLDFLYELGLIPSRYS